MTDQRREMLETVVLVGGGEVGRHSGKGREEGWRAETGLR